MQRPIRRNYQRIVLCEAHSFDPTYSYDSKEGGREVFSDTLSFEVLGKCQYCSF